MKLIKMRVTPFSVLKYPSKEIEDEWVSLFEKIRKTVNDAELLMVERGHRAAATYHLKKKSRTDELDRLRSRGLYFTPIHWVKSFEGFSHCHTYTTEDDPDAICYGVVARDRKNGELFKRASGGKDKPTNHDILGGLLGYPVCCRKFFADVWCKGYIDTIWQQALNTGGEFQRESYGRYSISVKGYPECVAMQRYWNIRISFHLPCSFRCEATKKWANVWYEVIGTIDPEIAVAIRRTLSLPTTWDAHRGVAVINTPFFKGMTSSVPCADIHTVYYSALQ